MYEVSYWSVPGIPNVETRYAIIIVVLATAVMTCYAFFMTPSHLYRLLSSIFCARKPSQDSSVEHEPISETKDAPVDFTSTCSKDLAPADKHDGPLCFQAFADPIVEHQVSPAESGPQIPDNLSLPQSDSTAAQPDAHLESGTAASESEGFKAEDPQLGSPELDTVFADLPFTADSEVELGVSSPNAAEGPCIVEVLGTACATSDNASDGSDDSRLDVRSAECLVTVPGPSLPQTLAPAEMDASMLSTEIPFLLSAESGRSMDDETHSVIERSAEDSTVAASLSTCGGPAETALAQTPCSTPDPLHGDVPSDIMHSALLVPALPATDHDESSDTVVGVEEDDDWTSVDPDESSTPRPSSPAEPRLEMVEAASVTRTEADDLALSAVLLTQSQYASVILSPDTSNVSNVSSPTSSASPTSSESVRPRVHTSDRPDWAIAPQEKQEDDAMRERTQRRHSADTPDWAVAPPEDTSGGVRKKGRRSDPGSGARRRPRRTWASR